MEWKWSNGSVVERSPRIQIPINHEQQPRQPQQPNNGASIQKEILDNNAFLQSLNCDPGFDFRENNKREESYNKMAEREMIAQIGQNPFFINNHLDNDEYVYNVSIQDKFLKPISTITTDKIKNPQQEQNM
jgi:hypothetical protein